MTSPVPIDVTELTAKVKGMYQAVAEKPHDAYHFEMGRDLADRLGYPAGVLDQVPLEAVESFAGVGYFFDLAQLVEGEQVLDLGSGSGMDAFFAAVQVGPQGHVHGIDMTEQQLAKAERLRAEAGSASTTFTPGRIEELPYDDASFDAVISNGVINLAPDKGRVFREAARVLRPGGRMVLADIVTETMLTDGIVGNVDLWASCIGGAFQQDRYQDAMSAAGLRVEVMRTNPYEFLSEQARGASERFGVKSVCVLARKT
ncbi:ubiquinone/menaquinone biosynthesis C-methylase UbiE [Lipingzhangella halophila]|uniref:Arsenite methyltransferase n=1 Tax=Lipingzhangella halophila TaxID=1783352 RepID=A0A7W7RNM7_9ACTN|nr:methyltransferase domain-containing protein [Lipingzhangella halophila]MBB4934823.1 ubiquinone/menaquinone biosynthesis C-methylase UbiE [Lipingzhangella halophila]